LSFSLKTVEQKRCNLQYLCTAPATFPPRFLRVEGRVRAHFSCFKPFCHNSLLPKNTAAIDETTVRHRSCGPYAALARGKKIYEKRMKKFALEHATRYSVEYLI
jgi:hypothetical protein